MLTFLRRHPVASAFLGILALGLGWLFLTDKSDETRLVYSTEKLTRGDIRRVVSASGTLSALVTVEVGSEVSGLIEQVFVDYNSPVERREIIAKIDPERFAATARQNEAQLAVARANVQVAQAEIERAEAALERERRAFERREKLVADGHASESDLDTARLNFATAKATLQTARSQLLTARAEVKQAQARLAQSRVDLVRTDIRSPIDGVVIERLVDPGQTVAASFNTPQLFRIAEDLSKMQVEADVDEADIGEVKDGQPVTFTVDAYPDERFEGTVRQIRKAPQEEQNVVTYTVVATAENPDEKLLPGMTATVEIETGFVTDVLRAPVAAGRFRPRPELIVPDARPEGPSGIPANALWQVADGGGNFVRPAPARFGLENTQWVEVTSASLSLGDEVVVRAAEASGERPRRRQ